MPRQQLVISEQAREQLRALAPIYGDMSRAAEAAIERLWRADLGAETPDAVLELVRRQLRIALAGVEGELERRAEVEARDD
jgi:hypothetical protein